MTCRGGSRCAWGRYAIAGLVLVALGGECEATAQAATEAPRTTVELSLAYTGEAWAVAGGSESGSTYLDNLDLGLSVDLEQLGWRGAAFSVSGLYNNRNQLSEGLIGDFQTVSNIDADGSPRLYELWLEQRVGSGLRTKVGVIDLNSEFDVNDAGSLFLNSSHGIAPDFSQVGANGPSIFPAPGLGGLVEAGAGGWTVRAGLFEGIARDPDRPRRTVFGFTSGEGALLVVETERQWEGGRALLGLRHHSGDFEPWAAAGAASARREDSSGAYLLVEDRLGRWDALALHGFTRIGLAEARIHEVGTYIGAGLVLQGPMFGLDDERLGVAAASAHNGRDFRRTVEPGGGASHETAVELTYSARLLPWLTVQPDVQWVVNPGFSGRTGDAFAFGLRLRAGWTWGL
jgi:porin